jgi:5,5'-dehydrodivanillate O-demethylase oxygenase subunit
MITQQENETLTRIGPGTPMGALMRRYWHPITGIDQMENRWTKRVRVLGEDLVLFKDRTGKYGLIGEFCPHRRASLAYGIPTEDGIRCPYHGWKFDAAGRCLEQPNEPEGSSFKDKVATAGYPVQEFAGLIWGYLGPLPAPLIPRLDGFVVEPAIRAVGITRVHCNWLQIMENSLDPVHTEWLHGKLYEFVREKDGVKVPLARHHVKIAFDEFEYGVYKRRLMEGQSEDCSDWRDGHPVVFPNILAVGSGGGLWKSYSFQIRVPIDDETTDHYWYNAFIPPRRVRVPVHLLDNCPAYDAPQRGAGGEYLLEYIYAQDVYAWETQGPIAQRDREALGTTDAGVILFRKMLQRELAKVERGEDPMCVIRDPARNKRIDLPLEVGKDMLSDGFASLVRRSPVDRAPFRDELLAVYRSGHQPRRPKAAYAVTA